MSTNKPGHFVPLDVQSPIWDHLFLVAPLVVIGTQDPDGTPDLAVKHMAMPMGWNNYFGFVCSPSHATYSNAKRLGCFTVSYPRADQIVLASLTASPRCEDGHKSALNAVPTVAARQIGAVFLEDAVLQLECALDRVVDGFDRNSLIVGRIIGAYIDEAALRVSDRDDQDVLSGSPLLAYISPGRYASIDHTQSFPFPAGFQK